MAVPPSYSDLGKAAKDIFSKGYGEYSFSPKSKLLTIRNSWNTEPLVFLLSLAVRLVSSVQVI